MRGGLLTFNVARHNRPAEGVAVCGRAHDPERRAVANDRLAAVKWRRAAVEPAGRVEDEGDEAALQAGGVLGLQRLLPEEADLVAALELGEGRLPNARGEGRGGGGGCEQRRRRCVLRGGGVARTSPTADPPRALTNPMPASIGVSATPRSACQWRYDFSAESESIAK